MNKEITVTNRMPQPPAINATLTGAAKRSADAATEAARQYFAALEQAERRLLNALNQEQNATNVAEAQRALAAIPEPGESLSPYWRSTATNEVSRVRHAIKEFAILSSGIPGVVADVPGDAARSLHFKLTQAGVPMPGGNIETPEYWDDAAARGC